ncbi:MAG: hypothetical protein UU76_C0003G0037 [Parcubacteria group bacterium GW2011_GWC1_41_7]|nr:MAG: hypothetical protein UU76_C0003G0037 [Parcubacteria group bacterium GW2011_GWC1_41_7]
MRIAFAASTPFALTGEKIKYAPDIVIAKTKSTTARGLSALVKATMQFKIAFNPFAPLAHSGADSGRIWL